MQMVLFPLHEDLTPDRARTEPSVWIRRLHILGDSSFTTARVKARWRCQFSNASSMSLATSKAALATPYRRLSTLLPLPKHHQAIVQRTNHTLVSSSKDENDDGRLLKRKF
jgi:hypothetical protein